MNADATIERLIATNKFENVALALNLAIGQKSDLAFSASEKYVEMFCERDGNLAQRQYTDLNLQATDYASECSQMAKLFGMLPHECFQQFPWFVKKGVESDIDLAYFGNELRLQRSACAKHEMDGRYWR